MFYNLLIIANWPIGPLPILATFFSIGRIAALLKRPVRRASQNDIGDFFAVCFFAQFLLVFLLFAIQSFWPGWIEASIRFSFFFAGCIFTSAIFAFMIEQILLTFTGDAPILGISAKRFLINSRSANYWVAFSFYIPSLVIWLIIFFNEHKLVGYPDNYQRYPFITLLLGDPKEIYGFSWAISTQGILFYLGLLTAWRLFFKVQDK